MKPQQLTSASLHILPIAVVSILIYLCLSTPIGASRSVQNIPFLRGEHTGVHVSPSTQAPRPLILISDQQFVSGEPRSQTAIQELLKAKKSILTQWKIAPDQDVLVSTPSGLAYLSEMYSVSPSILLTFADNKFRLLSVAADHENQLRPDATVFSSEMRQIAQALSVGFYEYYFGNASPEYVLANGEKVRAESGNASTYALRRYFASKTANSREWEENESRWEIEFVSAYSKLFGSPMEGNLNAAHPPLGTSGVSSLPTLKLPWKNGDSWWFTGGPHTFDGTGALSAVDYQPNGYAGCNPNVAGDRWIAASADGKTVDYQDNWLKLDHDQDGNVSTGWLTVYGHIANRIGNNVSVQQGALLGNPSCLGGVANGVHTHFGIKYQNVWQPINGTVVSGWTIENGSAAYHGFMRNGSTTKESCSRPGNGWDCSTALLVSDNGGGGGSGGPAGYAYCAKENERCNFSGTKDVAYGANGSFNYRYNLTGGVDCNNATFGDPISGVGKACYTKDSATQQCNPNSDQIALYVDGGYNGQCVVKGTGDYTNPGAIGLPNDSISSVKVGGNVKVKLCRDDNYSSTCEDFTGDDGNLGDNSIGDNQVSSAKVETRGGQTGCSPGSGEVAFFVDANYGGQCVKKGTGDYTNPGAIGLPNDSISSIKVGSSVKVKLCRDDNYSSTCEDFTGDDGNLSDNSIGDNQVSSAKVESRPPKPSANFDAWPQSGTAPLTVAMHIVDTANITSCAWNYGDGQTGTSCAPSHEHVFNSAGTFTVRLDVTGPGGSDTLTRTSYINVQSQVTAPAPPHDPTPPNGSVLSYRTSLDVSVQGDGEQFRIHVWGTNYDRWRDWDPSRALHLDGLTNQSYNMQAQAMNSVGYSDWSSVWTFTIQSPPAACYSLNTAANPSGGGSINVLTNQNCSGGYTSGTNVQIQAIPAAGYAFSHWSGGATGSSNPAAVTMNTAQTVTANFQAAGMVNLVGVETTDGPGNHQTTFNIGEVLGMRVYVNNTTSNAANITLSWDVYDPFGNKVNALSFDDWQTTVSPGSWWWGIGPTIPETAFGGTYTFRGTMILNGQTTTKSTEFQVIAPSRVYVDRVWTSNQSGQAKTRFIRREKIQYHAGIRNTGTTACDVHAVWQAKAGTTKLWSWSGTQTIQPGGWDVWFTGKIRATAPYTRYTLKVTTNCNGQTSSASKKFRVVAGTLVNDESGNELEGPMIQPLNLNLPNPSPITPIGPFPQLQE